MRTDDETKLILQSTRDAVKTSALLLGARDATVTADGWPDPALFAALCGRLVTEYQAEFDRHLSLTFGDSPVDPAQDAADENAFIAPMKPGEYYPRPVLEGWSGLGHERARAALLRLRVQGRVEKFDLVNGGGGFCFRLVDGKAAVRADEGGEG